MVPRLLFGDCQNIFKQRFLFNTGFSGFVMTLIATLSPWTLILPVIKACIAAVIHILKILYVRSQRPWLKWFLACSSKPFCNLPLAKASSI